VELFDIRTGQDASTKSQLELVQRQLSAQQQGNIDLQSLVDNLQSQLTKALQANSDLTVQHVQELGEQKVAVSRLHVRVKEAQQLEDELALLRDGKQKLQQEVRDLSAVLRLCKEAAQQQEEQVRTAQDATRMMQHQLDEAAFATRQQLEARDEELRLARQKTEDVQRNYESTREEFKVRL
jgi:hypothetical protein